MGRGRRSHGGFRRRTPTVVRPQRSARCGIPSRTRSNCHPAAHPARASARADLSDQGDRVIAVLLLDLLDEDGYLRAPLDSVAQLLGCEVGLIEAVLARLQQFDPAGVFARDLTECLALQLRDRNRFDPAMQALLHNLPLVAHLNIPALVRVCRVDAADVADMIAEIKSLDPRPGLAFDPPLAQPVVPDILMRAQPDGGWIIELNA